MTYKINVKIPKKDKYKMKTKVGLAMADVYASSPYLTKKEKDKKIKDLFK